MVTHHYDDNYFNWQKNVGAFGGVANLFKFTPFLSSTDRVLDYGCGGGYLLDNLNVQHKAGIEINPVAAQAARTHGIIVYECIEDVPDEFATVIISNHTLEHVEAPLDELKRLQSKLVSGGRMVFVVPHQRPHEPFTDQDINHHLYTWNPLTFGNLFKAAGYTIDTVQAIQHAWPPYYWRVYRLVGQTGFDNICRMYARLKGIYQIHLVAYKP